MKTLIRRIVRRFKRAQHLRQYTYGWIINPDGSKRNRARMNAKTGYAEFVLWRAGEQGHTVNFWHAMGYGWELKFMADIAGPSEMAKAKLNMYKKEITVEEI